ncbi:Lysophospholipase L1-like esterase [Frankia canadensis]|uniref:Lysophospholipase L1-like esterase n=1 Tax=Frankia canadensis TaxID=1836972 RepID=A0A2I2KND8_9ACTN|nr:SGNH/GDSL hydrolase family protein [Frankia canadensis]SNQ47187.1 Lysophospholipase L1-like esterase [Frankia canadensis]SOU54477.1 Lysophospholipase L1-like esterase [Frankia canadensis]
MPTVRFTALGDSFVEGRGDVGADGSYIGWARRFARRMGVSPRESRNLGAYQATTQEVVDRQLHQALARKAPLIGVVVGVNDMVQDWAPDRFARNLHTIFGSLAGLDTTVFTASYPDIPANLPLPDEFRNLLRERFAFANTVLREVCEATRTLHLDIAAGPEWSGRGLWSEDGLHPNTDGHRRFAEDMADLVERASWLTAA